MNDFAAELDDLFIHFTAQYVDESFTHAFGIKRVSYWEVVRVIKYEAYNTFLDSHFEIKESLLTDEQKDKVNKRLNEVIESWPHPNETRWEIQ